jgi:hypothetical protein
MCWIEVTRELPGLDCLGVVVGQSRDCRARQRQALEDAGETAADCSALRFGIKRLEIERRPDVILEEGAPQRVRRPIFAVIVQEFIEQLDELAGIIEGHSNGLGDVRAIRHTALGAHRDRPVQAIPQVLRVVIVDGHGRIRCLGASPGHDHQCGEPKRTHLAAFQHHCAGLEFAPG